jgi:hypothetical protein
VINGLAVASRTSRSRPRHHTSGRDLGQRRETGAPRAEMIDRCRPSLHGAARVHVDEWAVRMGLVAGLGGSSNVGRPSRSGGSSRCRSSCHWQPDDPVAVAGYPVFGYCFGAHGLLDAHSRSRTWKGFRLYSWSFSSRAMMRSAGRGSRQGMARRVADGTIDKIRARFGWEAVRLWLPRIP